MQNLPPDGAEPRGLRALRILVTVLTATMIGAVLVLLALFWTRLPGGGSLPLPEEIALPEGARAVGFATGEGWYAVVTADGRLLVFDPDGSLRREIVINER